MVTRVGYSANWIMRGLRTLEVYPYTFYPLRPPLVRGGPSHMRTLYYRVFKTNLYYIDICIYTYVVHTTYNVYFNVYIHYTCYYYPYTCIPYTLTLMLSPIYDLSKRAPLRAKRGRRTPVRGARLHSSQAGTGRRSGGELHNKRPPIRRHYSNYTQRIY